MVTYKRIVLIFSLWILATAPYAKEICGKQAFVIQPKDSSITFTAIQNNSPIVGAFNTFTGSITFDPANMKSSCIQIAVDMDSVTSRKSTVADTLKLPEWFHVKLFPKADFESNTIRKTGAKSYQAEGTLAIRDKTVPISFTFDLDEYSSTLLKLKGKTTLKRTQFGVGQDEWAKTDQIKDNVEVNFTLTARK